ncbi:winged helix-turn-helix domain-containing protein [Mesorhizobium escarrei]|uniref:Adenylate/guanylate cyclase domain-containing protein n=1 Tax=Mesorhizobium escarrei TaxID=666018 RepID=A0ABN8KHB8_9HYPH|nr:winged helix-turn-helix domain-containing protein [Mesorhizobium escarrei]CAH2409662.1 Adenylate/guanylate cyclase domain-containing protein [Mesorhizobium escarrei]
MHSPAPTLLRLDGRTVDLQCGSVTDQAGHTVILRPQAAEVLRLLALRSGTLVTKDELMQAVWGDIAVTDDSLVQCITEIRKALGDEKHEIVRTILKRGYVFEPGTQPGRRDRHRLITAVIGVAAIMAAMLWLAKPTPSPAPERLPSIAVLPFDDMSQDKSLAYMGDGVAEDIISMLARAPDVMVIARNSSFTYGGQPSDVRKIGRELGVDYVLEGSVRKEADKMRIVAQLNDTKTGKHLWAERFDKAGADPPALQDEVTGKIIAALTGERGQLKQSQYREAWGTDTAALAEYDYYLRAHDVYMKAETKDENDRAGRIWEEGLTKFPNSTLIKVKLGWYYWTAAWNWWSDDLTADFRKASSLVREVLAEDNLTPQVRRLAHWLFAFVLMREGDFAGSIQEADAAVAMGPYDAFVMVSLTEVLAASGQHEKALEWLALGEARDPSRKIKHHLMRAYNYRLMGRYEDSIGEYQQTEPMWAYSRLSLAINYVRLERLDEAKAAVTEALTANPRFTQAAWREGSFYSDPAILEGELADLAKAGLPEK